MCWLTADDFTLRSCDGWFGWRVVNNRKRNCSPKSSSSSKFSCQLMSLLHVYFSSYLIMIAALVCFWSSENVCCKIMNTNNILLCNSGEHGTRMSLQSLSVRLFVWQTSSSEMYGSWYLLNVFCWSASCAFVCLSTFLYLKFLLVWALVLLADFVLEFRFEYLWPFWLFIRSVYDSFRYQGLVSDIHLSKQVVVIMEVPYIQDRACNNDDVTRDSNAVRSWQKMLPETIIK